MNELTQSQLLLHKLMETNKTIILIKELAFQIKLKSINEQILAIRNDLSGTGFQVVSREFIGFSRSFEELALEMQTLMDEMLVSISGTLKQEKFENYKIKANKISGKAHFSIIKKEQTLFEGTNLSFRLKKLIGKVSLLSLKGNNIFIQSKITGAYIQDSEKHTLVNSLIFELGDIMEKVRICTNTIKKIWV